MTRPRLPRLWLDLLAEAGAAPDGILSLKDDSRGEEAETAAERMTDLGLLRIVTARRYRLGEAGRAALAAEKAGQSRKSLPAAPDQPGDPPGSPDGSFWSKLFGKR